MAKVGEDLKAHLVPSPAMGGVANHQIRLSRIPSNLECLQGWRIA